MKRSTGKKAEKPAAKEEQPQYEDNSAWFDVMRQTLNPYWSARVERTTPRSEDEAA